VTGLDTNVLVRFFAKDDPQQSPKARAVLESLSMSEPGWVGVATILELVWVMRSKFRMGRAGIAGILSHLLSQEAIVIEHTEIIDLALELYQTGKADFADCLIASSARASGCVRVLTFDEEAARDAGMQLIP
jgi:predicted nucleic-acid-binding protein